jgi:hypothetical protein
MLFVNFFIADALTGGLLGKLGWVLLVVIILAFLVFGLRDVARLSWARISAIASVSFAESIRRRVLWITPLAILGAIVVSQLQNPLDPQDSIRQTTKICLFTAGLVVTLVAIILASTNLQKEIETRVIYTIVTKPTTRLEIVIGKVWGFAKVSAAILLIMGVFTYAYLHIRAWRLNSGIATALEAAPADAINRETLEYYRNAGLLSAKSMTHAASMQMLARPPVEGQPRWMMGGQGQRFVVDFKFADDDYEVVADALRSGGRVSVVLDMPVAVREPTASELETMRMTNIPTEEQPATGPTTAEAAAGPAAPSPQTTAATTQPMPVPVVGIAMTAKDGEQLVVEPKDFNNNQPMKLSRSKPGPVEGQISPTGLERLFKISEFRVTVEGSSPAVEYAVGDKPVTIKVFRGDNSIAKTFQPVDPAPPLVSSSRGRFGQQLVGGPEGVGGVAVYRFEGAKPAAAKGDQLTFEIKVGIERGGEGVEELQTTPEVELRVLDRSTGAISASVTFRPENNRISFKSLPRSAFPEDGNFDVLLRVLAPDQWLGVQQQSVALATASRPFGMSLFMSVTVLWLMSILVTAIAVFCSTFVSWPIAIVLTLLILLGRWGVEQVGDSAGTGIGAMISSQTQDPVQAKLMRGTGDFLAKLLEVVSPFLPNISMFQATADIERGISVPFSRLSSAGWVLLGYGLPMIILAYLILKWKEVAP